LNKLIAEALGVASAGQTAATAGTGLIGLILTYSFGGWSELLGFFLLAIVIDYATGVGASVKEGQGLNSETGFWGLIKKALMILVIVLAHRADVALELEVLMYGTLYAFLLNEILSIAENCGRLGVPLPQAFKGIITVLKSRTGEAGKGEGR